MKSILTIDLGTTYFKIAIFDRGGQLREVCRIAPPLAAAEGGRIELSADAFADAIGQGIAELGRRAAGGLADVEAVCFATQTNSFVLLDADGRALTPIVLWPDLRALEMEAELRSRSAIPSFTATTGVPQWDAQFMAAKLLWLQRHEPTIWSRAAKVCLISDYLTWLFTGKHATEAGAAGLTGLVDIHRCQWWPEMLARLDLAENRVPAVVRAGSDLGPMDPQAAARFGLPAACRFVVGCLDQYAGAIGAGNVAPGMISETTGTVLATVRCDNRFAAQLAPSVFQGPAFREGLYWRMAFGDISANLLQWYRDQLPDLPTFDELGTLAEPIEAGAEGLRVNTRAWPAAKEVDRVFEHFAPRHTRGHFVRCIMEAVAEALGEQMAALSDGSLPGEIRCAGGAARSAVWLQIKADRLGVATVASQCPEPTSLGAAMLAEAALRRRETRASDTASSIEEIAREWVRLANPHVPDPRQRQRYQSIFASTGPMG